MLELKSWHEKYLKKEIINIRENLDSNDLEILFKLGINTEIYTHLYNKEIQNAMLGHPLSKFKISNALAYIG